MNMTANYLLTKDSQTVQEWLEQVWSKQTWVSDDFNWLGLAQVAVQKATGTTSEQEAKLKWAEIALNVYAYLTRQDVNGQNSFELSAMHLRAAMIRQFGAVADHPILDGKPIAKWFFDRTFTPREEVMQVLGGWRKLPIQDILKLRKIKNRLSVIELLMQDGYLQEHHELREWVMIKKYLP
jgi:hypothetical protein